jgi:hypothetical protein
MRARNDGNGPTMAFEGTYMVNGGSGRCRAEDGSGGRLGAWTVRAWTYGAGKSGGRGRGGRWERAEGKRVGAGWFVIKNTGHPVLLMTRMKIMWGGRRGSDMIMLVGGLTKRVKYDMMVATEARSAMEERRERPQSTRDWR